MSKDKGVSEIIATVLMIMIVTVLGFTIFLYGLGFFTASTSAYNQATSTSILALNERFVIIDVNFTVGSPNSVTAWVYNYGSTNLKIVGMYLNGTQLSSVSTSIFPNRIVPVTGTFTLTFGNSSIQTIRVVSSLGNYYENDFMPH